MTRLASVRFAVVGWLLTLSVLVGCGGDHGPASTSKPNARWWQVGYSDGYRAGYQTCCQDIQERKWQVITTMRRDISGHLILASLIAVFGIVFGPSVADSCRARVARAFKLPLARQVQLAHALFWSLLVVTAFTSFVNGELRLVAPAVWMLLAGALFVFLREFLPAVEEENKAVRKASLGKIKGCLFLILVFYVLLRILSERGFLNLTVAT